jgi:hypothetical protein
MAAQNDCIPVMLAAAEEPMTEVQENMWVTNAKAARSAPANAAHLNVWARPLTRGQLRFQRELVSSAAVVVSPRFFRTSSTT